MKKTILTSMVAGLIFTSILTLMSFKIKSEDCQVSTSRIATPIPDLESGKPKKKVRFALRHSDDTDPNTPPCSCPKCKIPGCPCPLGICAVYGIMDDGIALSADDLELQNSGELGRADLWVIDGGTKMVMSFDQITAYTDPNSPGNKIVEFDGNYTLTGSIASGLGCNSVTILAGVYTAIFEAGYPNGYVILNVSSN